MSGFLVVLAGGGTNLVSVSPSEAEGIGSGATVTTNSVDAVVSGAGAYTYSWQYVSGDATFSALFPGSSVTQQWSASGLGVSETRSATWRVVVTLDGTSIGQVLLPVSVTREV